MTREHGLYRGQTWQLGHFFKYPQNITFEEAGKTKTKKIYSKERKNDEEASDDRGGSYDSDGFIFQLGYGGGGSIRPRRLLRRLLHRLRPT